MQTFHCFQGRRNL